MRTPAEPGNERLTVLTALMGSSLSPAAGWASDTTVRRCCAGSEPDGCGSRSTRPGSGCISLVSARPRSGWPAWARCTRRPPARARLGQQRGRRDFPAIQAEGVRVCLFTDQANPTSNKIYAALGYQPVADMANPVIAR